MRYHFVKPKHNRSHYGLIYRCDHPVYDICTVFLIGDKGFAVIQQRFDRKTKSTRWTEIDQCLIDAVYLNSGFKAFFDEFARAPTNGLYPTVTIRQLMWRLKMKPLRRERWETTFDHRDI